MDGKEDGLEIALTEAGHVQIKLDMTAYCEACDALIQIRAAKEALEDETGDSSELDEAYREAQAQFDSEYARMNQYTNTFDGELYWLNIKTLFADHIQEGPLYDALISGFDTGDEPLVIEALNNSFPELLKNSIDACIKKFLHSDKKDEAGKLEIDLQMTLDEEENVHFTMTDNGTGFPENYLENIDKDLEEKNYLLLKEEKATEKGSDSWYLFGGAGKGLRILYNLLLNGARLGSSGNSETLYDSDESQASEKLYLASEALYEVPQGTTQAVMTNSPEGGAQITLSSPLRPFPEYQPESPSWSSASEEEDEVELSLPLNIKKEKKEETKEEEVKLDLPPSALQRYRLFSRRETPPTTPPEEHANPKKPKPSHETSEKTEKDETDSHTPKFKR